MNAKNDPAPRKRGETPLEKRRFVIDKLEERIAPKKGGKGTNNCPTVGCATTGCGGY
jgi:hypothetical protein